MVDVPSYKVVTRIQKKWQIGIKTKLEAGMNIYTFSILNVPVMR